MKDDSLSERADIHDTTLDAKNLAEELIAKAKEACAKRNIDEARKYFNELIDKVPQYPDLYFFIADIYFENEHWQDAAEMFSKVIQEDEEVEWAVFYSRGYAYQNLGESYLKQGDVEKCLACFAKAEQDYKQAVEKDAKIVDENYKIEDLQLAIISSFKVLYKNLTESRIVKENKQEQKQVPVIATVQVNNAVDSLAQITKIFQADRCDQESANNNEIQRSDEKRCEDEQRNCDAEDIDSDLEDNIPTVESVGLKTISQKILVQGPSHNDEKFSINKKTNHSGLILATKYVRVSPRKNVYSDLEDNPIPSVDSVGLETVPQKISVPGQCYNDVYIAEFENSIPLVDSVDFLKAQQKLLAQKQGSNEEKCWVHHLTRLKAEPELILLEIANGHFDALADIKQDFLEQVQGISDEICKELENAQNAKYRTAIQNIVNAENMANKIEVLLTFDLLFPFFPEVDECLKKTQWLHNFFIAEIKTLAKEKADRFEKFSILLLKVLVLAKYEDNDLFSSRRLQEVSRNELPRAFYSKSAGFLGVSIGNDLLMQQVMSSANSMVAAFKRPMVEISPSFMREAANRNHSPETPPSRSSSTSLSNSDDERTPSLNSPETVLEAIDAQSDDEDQATPKFFKPIDDAQPVSSPRFSSASMSVATLLSNSPGFAGAANCNVIPERAIKKQSKQSINELGTSSLSQTTKF